MRRRLKRLVGGGYRRIVRPLMPVSAPAFYAGVPVSVDRLLGDRLLDRLFGPFHTEDIPLYEFTLAAGLRRHVRPDDRVVIVGGGFGVTVVIAALMSAPNGTVTCFEGGAEQAERTREAARRNAVADRVTVRHAVVGPADRVYGTAGEAARLAPEDLPACDVLELDCEGAETAILSNLKIRPPTILVETHGLYGAPASLSRTLLAELGYGVTDLGIAEPRSPSFCEDNDIRVLCGRWPGGGAARQIGDEGMGEAT
jgi:hypothetical protein